MKIFVRNRVYARASLVGTPLDYQYMYIDSYSTTSTKTDQYVLSIQCCQCLLIIRILVENFEILTVSSIVWGHL